MIMTEKTNIVSDGLVVSLDYTLTVDGKVLDASGETPLEYLHGYRNIIPGLERELAGMALGESKEVAVAAKDAYGEYDPEAIFEVPRAQFPSAYRLEVGAPVQVRTDTGHVMTAYIHAVGEESVRLDLNHPLAGKELYFRAKIVGLREGTMDELAAGRVGGASCACCGSSEDCNGDCA
jgi:FKBP-type peptidyl-prolyl cis-trans isomerase SlyD